jgi:hypothetical protein
MSAKGKITLKKNKDIDRIWHPESTLIFKSAAEKVVVGRYDNEEIIPLDDECISLCEEWGFKYDTDLVEKEEQEEDKEDEEEKEEEEKPALKSIEKIKEAIKQVVPAVEPEKSASGRTIIKTHHPATYVGDIINLPNPVPTMIDDFVRNIAVIKHATSEIEAIVALMADRSTSLYEKYEESQRNEEILRAKLNKLKSMFE